VLVRLAGGWWSDMVSFLRVNTGFYGDRPSLLARLVLEEADGRRTTVVTEPGTWQLRTDGPIRNGSFFQGERYDARLEPNETAESGWRDAVVVEPMARFAAPALVAKRDDPVRVVERRIGRLVGETRSGSDAWIYDMGVNMVGVPQIDVDLPEGTELVLRTAEMRYPDLPVYREQGLHGLLMTENLREALSTDFYTAAGGPRRWHPRFTFHGYRYVEISGTSGPLPPEAVQGLVLSSVEMTGDVDTSDPALNRLMRNIQRSQTGNFLSIPTDCPQRNERLGWLEAVTEFARTSLFTSDAAAFTGRFLDLLRDSQVDDELLRDATDPLGFHEDGHAVLAVEDGVPRALFTAPAVSGMYPSYVPGFDAYRSWGTPWSSAGVLVPYELYRHHGALEVVRRSFDSMRRYLEAMHGLRLPGSSALSSDGGSCGDWLALDKPPHAYTDATVYAWSLRCFAEMAEAIGEHATARDYDERWQAARLEWNARFVDPASGRLRSPDAGESQSACVLALAYGLPFPEHRPGIEAALCAAVERGWNGAPYGITTGLFTTPMINLVLSDIGRSDLAYAMIENRAFPSWLYPVTQGATSVWERWNSFTEEGGFASGNAMNSFNHFSLGGVGAWLFNRVVGIDRDPARPGMQHVLLHPVPGGSLTSAAGRTRTDHGIVEASWAYTEDRARWTYSVRLPASTGATIDLPWAGGARFEVGAGAWRVVVEDGSAELQEA
uniref:family 78 glycoside hydrolase catalytic domain n=1 Tax=uncultured Amnibacterium sp. TaxID=1631851 RepID=UPI0035CC6AA4